MFKLILASSSTARAKQLAQLGIDFDTVSPDIDETAKPGENTDDLVLRLAQEKAEKVARDFPDHWIIACDQLAEFNGQNFGKPHTKEKALETLMQFSGQTVLSKTGICLLNKNQNVLLTALEPFSVIFRKYSKEDAQQYIAIDKPLHSAGSINIDSLGVVLIERYEGNDYNSVIGLPLITLVNLFQQAGVNLLSVAREKNGLNKIHT